jgi:hypothetical protein
MPLSKPEDFGTTADGFRQNDYCSNCYKDGEFTQPDATLEQMIGFCVSPTVEATGLSEEDARGMLEHTLPMLKRWQGTV